MSAVEGLRRAHICRRDGARVSGWKLCRAEAACDTPGELFLTWMFLGGMVLALHLALLL